MKSNRKIHGVSDTSYERLGNRKMLCLSVWGLGRQGTKRFVDNKITSNPNWPTLWSPDPINLTLVNSVLQSKHLRIYFGLSITRTFSRQWSAAHVFVWQPQRPERQSSWSLSYRLLTGGFSSRSSKYISLSNSHNMLITRAIMLIYSKPLVAETHILWAVLPLYVQMHHTYSQVNVQCPFFPIEYTSTQQYIKCSNITFSRSLCIHCLHSRCSLTPSNGETG